MGCVEVAKTPKCFSTGLVGPEKNNLLSRESQRKPDACGFRLSLGGAGLEPATSGL